MREPMQNLEDFWTRMSALQRLIPHLSDLAVCEHALGELKEGLRYCRHVLHHLESRQQEKPCEADRVVSEAIRKSMRGLKEMHYQYLRCQERNLARSADERHEDGNVR
jgi:hypothetical protein